MSDARSSDEASPNHQKRLQEMEAKAVDKAKATADHAFRPSPSILNAQSAAVLLQQVDGPSLQTYEGKESVYVGRSVPVAAGGQLNVPIQVSTPGSVVEYAVELKAYDINFGITAERDEGSTIVKVSVEDKADSLVGHGAWCVRACVCACVLCIFFWGVLT